MSVIRNSNTPFTQCGYRNAHKPPCKVLTTGSKRCFVCHKLHIMETSTKVLRRTGKTSLQKVIRFFNDFQQNIAELQEAEVQVIETIRDGQVRIMFNIDNLKLEVAVKQNEL